MKIDLSSGCIQPWQISEWVEQGYLVMSFIEGYKGPIKSVSHGNITIAGQGGVSIVVESIPSVSAQVEGPYILIGYPE